MGSWALVGFAVVAAQQQVTIDWWTSRRAYSLFASDFVLDEAGRGDPMLNDNYIAPTCCLTSECYPEAGAKSWSESGVGKKPKGIQLGRKSSQFYLEVIRDFGRFQQS